MRAAWPFAICLLFSGSALAAEPVKPAEPAKPAAEKPAEAKPAGKVISLFDGKSLDGWKIIDKDSFEDHGKVSIDKGTILLEAGKPATGIAWNRKEAPPKNNYEITLEAMRVDGDDFFCGLTFPVDKSSLSMIIGGWGGMVTGLSNINGEAAIENETTNAEEFKNGQWYKIRLRVTPKNISAWIDGKQIIDVEVGDKKFDIWWEQEPTKPLGIVTWRTKGALRNIQLTILDAPKK